MSAVEFCALDMLYLRRSRPDDRAMMEAVDGTRGKAESRRTVWVAGIRPGSNRLDDGLPSLTSAERRTAKRYMLRAQVEDGFREKSCVDTTPQVVAAWKFKHHKNGGLTNVGVFHHSGG